ncbi:MAG: GNAT family N-acetyltransferase [Caulobacteraceae bacterium]|nr:MAG: GNAT family N-acetyltransferase [Caulobacteraceae bacterium]
MALRLVPFDPAAHADLVRPLAQLWLDSWRSTGTANEEVVLVEDLAARIAEEAATVWEVTLAFEDEALAGFMALRPHDACLDQLFMSPTAKGQGIGSRLIDLAKQRLPGGMWLRTAEANHAARAFYEKRGFHHYETDQHPTLGYARVFYRWP